MHTIEILTNLTDAVADWRQQFDEFEPVYTGHTSGAGRDFPAEVDYDDSGLDTLIEEAQEAIYDAGNVPGATRASLTVTESLIADFGDLSSELADIEAHVLTTYADALELHHTAK